MLHTYIFPLCVYLSSAWEIILITWQQSKPLQSTSVQDVWETDPISSHAFICLIVLICSLYFSVCMPQVVEKQDWLCQCCNPCEYQLLLSLPKPFSAPFLMEWMD